MKTQGIAGIVVALTCSVASASTIAAWTFETSQPSVSNATDAGPFAAEVGTGSASGHHASANTDYSSPAGNGSAHSFSSNTWAVGDYYQFQTSAADFTDLTLTFDQTRSSTGPASFNLQYSTDGAAYTTLAPFSPYAVAATTWDTSNAMAASKYTVDLSVIPALNHSATVFFRLTAAGDPSSAAGTVRVDNVSVEGTAVPEPAAVGIALMTWCLAVRRLRSR